MQDEPNLVLVVDDHPIVREGLRAVLEREEDIEVVGEAQNGLQAVALAEQLRPAVVLMDISMPLLNGLEATRMILSALPGTKILILSNHEEKAYVEQAAKLGAAGYLLKFSIQLVSKAVRDVQKGRMFFSPSTAKPAHNRKSKLDHKL